MKHTLLKYTSHLNFLFTFRRGLSFMSNWLMEWPPVYKIYKKNNSLSVQYLLLQIVKILFSVWNQGEKSKVHANIIVIIPRVSDLLLVRYIVAFTFCYQSHKGESENIHFLWKPPTCLYLIKNLTKVVCIHSLNFLING